MKNLILTMTLIMCAAVGHAADLNACLNYLYPDAPQGSWVLQDDGNGAYIREWKLPGAKPSLAELDVVNKEALEWWEIRRQEKDIETALEDKAIKALVEALLAEVNTLRTQLSMPVRTLDDLKSQAATTLVEEATDSQ